MPKDTRIAFRASGDLKQRLQSASKKVGLSETTLAEACVEALVKYIEEHGGIWLPLEIVPANKKNRSSVDYRETEGTAGLMAAEDHPNEGGRSKRRSA